MKELFNISQVDTFAINNNAVIGLLKGVAAIVSYIPHQDALPALRQICLLQVKPLLDLMETDAVPVKGTKTDPVLWLDRLASVFRHTVIGINSHGNYVILSTI